MAMPIFNVEEICADFSETDRRIIGMCFTSRGVKEGARLRSNKPFKTVSTFEQGIANYVWRMLCFDLVGEGKHACMPVCADFDLSMAQQISEGRRIRYNEPGYDGYKARGKFIRAGADDIVKQFEAKIPLSAQKGIVRWGRALGML